MNTILKRFGACALIALLASGCAWVKQASQNPAKATQIASIAAYDIADVLLIENPGRRPKFELALQQLRTLQARGVYDAASIITILRQVPAAALQTPRARIAYDAGTIMVLSLGDPAVNAKTQLALQAIVSGFIDGLERRLSTL